MLGLRELGVRLVGRLLYELGGADGASPRPAGHGLLCGGSHHCAWSLRAKLILRDRHEMRFTVRSFAHHQLMTCG